MDPVASSALGLERSHPQVRIARGYDLLRYGLGVHVEKGMGGIAMQLKALSLSVDSVTSITFSTDARAVCHGDVAL